MKIPYIPNKLVAKLIRVLQSITSIHSIYLMGSEKQNRTSSYVFSPNKVSPVEDLYTLTLVIISEEEISLPKRFMNEVFTKMDQRVKIYSIHYTQNEVVHRLNCGDNFLSRILLPENEIFGKHRFLVFGYCHHPKMYDKIKEAWEFRMNRAYYFEEKVDVLDTFCDLNAKMLLLSQAVQQACAALLYVFWEFSPSHCDLNYLLHLCRHFCHSPKMIFPKTSFRSYKVYHALRHAQYNVNFKSTSNVSLEDTYYAHDMCRRFLDKAFKEGQERLRELKNIHSYPQ